MVFPSDILNNNVDSSGQGINTQVFFCFFFKHEDNKLFLAYTASSQTGSFLELWTTCKFLSSITLESPFASLN